MNVFVDSTGTMRFGDERETARNCPHCHAFSRMSPTALPTFDELLLQKPRSVGLVLRCHACNAPVFLRYATRAFASNRVELSPQAFDVERPVEKFAFNYVPEDVETFFREALVCYSHNQFQAFAVGQGNRLGLEGLAQGVRHSFCIAEIAHGMSSALANEKCQALALLTRSLGQRVPERLDTFTVPHERAQAAGRIHPTKNMRPGPSGCQLQTSSSRRCLHRCDVTARS